MRGAGTAAQAVQRLLRDAGVEAVANEIVGVLPAGAILNSSPTHMTYLW